jgi:hypothetical protein
VWTAALIVVILLLGAALVLREPELRRRIAATVLREQGAVRAGFGLFAPKDLQRQALARIKEKALVSIGFAHLPTDVTVLLNAEDLERLGATRDDVAEELAEQMAQLQGKNAGGSVIFALGARPKVRMEGDPRVQPGTVDVRAAWLEGTAAVTALLGTEKASEPGPSMRLRIEVEGQGASEAFLAGRMVLGRAPTCDVAINHLGVSREHALLAVVDAGEASIVDLDSSNGVEIAGVGRIQPQKPIEIKVGDAFRLSKHVRLELLAAEPPTEVVTGGEEADD